METNIHVHNHAYTYACRQSMFFQKVCMLVNQWSSMQFCFNLNCISQMITLTRIATLSNPTLSEGGNETWLKWHEYKPNVNIIQMYHHEHYLCAGNVTPTDLILRKYFSIPSDNEQQTLLCPPITHIMWPAYHMKYFTSAICDGAATTGMIWQLKVVSTARVFLGELKWSIDYVLWMLTMKKTAQLAGSFPLVPQIMEAFVTLKSPRVHRNWLYFAW